MNVVIRQKRVEMIPHHKNGISTNYEISILNSFSESQIITVWWGKKSSIIVQPKKKDIEVGAQDKQKGSNIRLLLKKPTFWLFSIMYVSHGFCSESFSHLDWFHQPISSITTTATIVVRGIATISNLGGQVLMKCSDQYILIMKYPKLQIKCPNQKLILVFIGR